MVLSSLTIYYYNVKYFPKTYIKAITKSKKEEKASFNISIQTQKVNLHHSHLHPPPLGRVKVEGIMN
jgi:hypothetical protein